MFISHIYFILNEIMLDISNINSITFTSRNGVCCGMIIISIILIIIAIIALEILLYPIIMLIDMASRKKWGWFLLTLLCMFGGYILACLPAFLYGMFVIDPIEEKYSGVDRAFKCLNCGKKGWLKGKFFQLEFEKTLIYQCVKCGGTWCQPCAMGLSKSLFTRCHLCRGKLSTKRPELRPPNCRPIHHPKAIIKKVNPPKIIIK